MSLVYDNATCKQAIFTYAFSGQNLNNDNIVFTVKKLVSNFKRDFPLLFKIGYDESFFFIDGEKYVRTTSIDSQNHMILNDQIIKSEDFDKYFIEIFMTYSLKDLTAYSNPNIPNPKHPLLLSVLKKIR